MSKNWYIVHTYTGYEKKILRTVNQMLEAGELDSNIVTDVKVPEEEVVEKRAPKILAQGQLEDFAFDFMKSKEFSMTGEDSNIETMDIGRNIADSKKEEILDQYRFFVDDSRKTPFVSEDGVVRRVNR